MAGFRHDAAIPSAARNLQSVVYGLFVVRHPLLVASLYVEHHLLAGVVLFCCSLPRYSLPSLATPSLAAQHRSSPQRGALSPYPRC